MIHRLCKTVRDLLQGVLWKYIELRRLLAVKRWRKTREHQYDDITVAREMCFCRMVFKCYCLNLGSSDLRKNSSKSQTQTNLLSLMFTPKLAYLFFFVWEIESQCLFNVSVKLLIWKYPTESLIAIVG